MHSNLYKRIVQRWFDKLPVGSFEGDFSLIWTGPGRKFLYIPNYKTPFKFTRANGEVIQPGVMATDAGSIPQLFHSIVDPWTYLPGFIIHDYEFGIGPNGTKPFKDVNKTLAEAIKTQMTNGYLNTEIPRTNALDVKTIYSGVNSFVGKGIWNDQDGTQET